MEMPGEEALREGMAAFASQSASSRVETHPFDSTLSAVDAQRQSDIAEHAKNIRYSTRYCDEKYQYRHVIIPKQLVRYLPKDRLMTETEWRSLGLQQSPGWDHFMIHQPEPHVLIFRRSKDE